MDKPQKNPGDPDLDPADLPIPFDATPGQDEEFGVYAAMKDLTKRKSFSQPSGPSAQPDKPAGAGVPGPTDSGTGGRRGSGLGSLLGILGRRSS